MNGTLSSNSTSHAQFGGTINIASIVLGFVIVVLNARAVVTIGRTRALKTTSNIYVASLAVTDVMVGSMLFVMKLVEHLGYCEWLDDNKLASVGAFCLTLTAYMASTLTTVAIAVDRYAYISWPNFYKSNVTPRRVVLSMLPVWTVSFGLAVLMTALKSADS
nr:hypothetical protein BaRGS_013408 [Batillaria attramentaria]